MEDEAVDHEMALLEFFFGTTLLSIELVYEYHAFLLDICLFVVISLLKLSTTPCR